MQDTLTFVCCKIIRVRNNQICQERKDYKDKLTYPRQTEVLG